MYNFFSILILTTAFLFSSCCDKSSIINGSITENNIKYVLYSNPDLPICYDKFMDTVKVNNYGSFEIQLSSKLFLRICFIMALFLGHDVYNTKSRICE